MSYEKPVTLSSVPPLHRKPVSVGLSVSALMLTGSDLKDLSGALLIYATTSAPGRTTPPVPGAATGTATPVVEPAPPVAA